MACVMGYGHDAGWSQAEVEMTVSGRPGKEVLAGRRKIAVPLGTDLREKRMAHREHIYTPTVLWSGNLGEGTSGYQRYSRDNEIRHQGKATIAGSSDASFRGDPTRWNPEDLLAAALAQCHMLAFLHAAADNGMSVLGYTDSPVGTMEETPDGGGHFVSVVLHPLVTVAEGSDVLRLDALHEKAHQLCFVANSVNFPVTHQASFATRTPTRTNC